MINFNLLFLVLFIAVISYVAYTLFIKKEKNDNANTENTSQDSTPEDSNVKDNENINSSLKEQNKDSELESSKPQDTGAFVGGVALILFINFLVFCLGVILLVSSYGKSDAGPEISLGALFTVLIGLGQLLYVIPLVIWLRKSGASTLAKGITTGAIITALLTGGCYLTLAMDHLPSSVGHLSPMMIYIIFPTLIALLIAIPIFMHRKTKQDDDKHDNS